MNILTGIADEAANDIEGQIRIHQKLGWKHMELRTIDGKNIAGELSDVEFDAACDQLEKAEMQVTAFASAIGNWSRPIDGNFALDVQDLRIAAKRMNRLRTKYIRTMSWLQGDASEEYWKVETIHRYKELAEIAKDHDIILAHENCTGWAGLDGANMRALIKEVQSEHVKVLFDIGNTVSHGYKPWEFYHQIKDLICYVHVKDCKRAPEGGHSQNYQLLGDGDADVKNILRDILNNGYKGIISIEPHIAKVIHNAKETSPEKMAESYINYARRFEEIMEEVRAPAADDEVLTLS